MTQRDVVRLVFDPQWSPERHERVLMITPSAFDASTYEAWMPLLHGGHIVLAPPGEIGTDTLRRLIDEERITGIHLTSELFRSVAEDSPEVLSGLSEVLTSGDGIEPEAVRRVLDSCPGLVVRAMYGAAEGSLFSAHHPLDADSHEGGMPIGTALTDTALHILDEHLRPVQDGAEGEVYLGGRGVARGYLGEPERTAERFVADPFGVPGSRMFRTGDRARRTGDGLIEYAGRTGREPNLEETAVQLTSRQEALCAIFASVLEVPEVGIDDSFFDLGGQSLQAMRLLARVRSELGVDILINTLFDAPTVAGLDDYIESTRAAA